MEGQRPDPASEAAAAEARGWTKQTSGLIVPPQHRADLPERISEWAARIGTVAAALAGLVIVVHLLGGIVMWLRFRKAGLPADQAVAFMTREQMLTIGLRLIVLPVIVTGALALLLVLAQQKRLLRRTGAKIALGLAGLVALALALTLPGSWASLTWIGLALVILYWWRGFGISPRPRGELASPWRLAAVAVLAAAIISLGRQVDEPVQLLQVQLAIEGQKKPVEGVFVAADANAVYVGDTRTDTIQGYRRTDVRSVSLGPPAERAPNRSILSKLFWGDEKWALTPVRWWCNGEDYSWGRVGDLCQTQPEPHAQRRALDVRWIPIRVKCPPEAKDGCEGHLRFTTVRTYGNALGSSAPRRRVSFPRDGLPPVPFTIARDRTRELCVLTNPQERDLLRAAPDGLDEPEAPVQLEVVLTSDVEGESQMVRQEYRLDVAGNNADPSLIPASQCSGELRAGLMRRHGRAAEAEPLAVHDGDTLDVRVGGFRRRVRLLGLDAPESPKLGQFACGQKEGIDHLLRLLFSAPEDADGDGLADGPGGEPRTLELEPDPNRPDRDAASRLLRYATVAGADRTVQEDLLEAGWAKLGEREPGPRLAHARELERAAERAEGGLAELC